ERGAGGGREAAGGEGGVGPARGGVRWGTHDAGRGPGETPGRRAPGGVGSWGTADRRFLAAIAKALMVPARTCGTELAAGSIIISIRPAIRSRMPDSVLGTN